MKDKKKEPNFYQDNAKYKVLNDKLDKFEDRLLLIDIVEEAIIYGMDLK
jgi:hypothetical protein